MYQLKDIIARLSKSKSNYIKVTNKNSIKLNELLSDYRDIHIELSHSSLPDTRLWLKVNEVGEILYTTNRDVTVQEWLDSLGNSTLPTVEGELEHNECNIIHSNLLDIGFKTSLVDENFQESTHRHREDLIHVKLSDNKDKYKDYHDYCLFTCNGLLHIHDYDETGIYLENAGTSTLIENKIQFSSISFQEIGKIKTYPITEEMISREGGNRYHNGFYLNLPVEDLSDKTVMLSICGILHYNDDKYQIVSDTSIRIEWNKIGFVNRYVDLRHKLDWGRVRDLIDKSNEEGNIFVDRVEAESDDAILSALLMSQTFIIIIDNKDLTYDKIAVERSRLPGRYLLNYNPVGPIVLANGLMHPYRVRETGNGIHQIIMTENWIRNKIEDTRGEHSSRNIMTNDKSQWSRYISDAFVLKISKEEISL